MDGKEHLLALSADFCRTLTSVLTVLILLEDIFHDFKLLRTIQKGLVQSLVLIRHIDWAG